MVDLDRRELVKKTGATATIPLVVGMAGCSSGESDNTTTNTESTTATVEAGGEVPGFEMLYWSGYPWSEAMARRTKQNFEELGMPVELSPMQVSQGFPTALNKEPWIGMVVITWGASRARADPHWWLSRLFHSRNAEEGKYNIAGVEDSELDQLIEQQARTLDTEERNQLIKQAQQRILDKHYQYPVSFRLIVSSYYEDRLSNLRPKIGLGLRTYNVTNAVNMRTSASDNRVVSGDTIGAQTNNYVAARSSNVAGIGRLVYDTLLSSDQELNLIPWLAEDYTASGTTIEFQIREGHEFHDGTPVTPEDVKFSYELAQEYNLPSLGADIEKVESIEIDGQTVRFNLTEPWAPILTVLFAWHIIVPKHIWEDRSDPLNANVEDPVGSGPFKLRNFETNQVVSLEANQNHFNAPNIDRLDHVIYPGTTQLVRDLRGGAIDIAAGNLSLQQARELENTVDAIGTDVTDSHGAYVLYPVVFNDRVPWSNEKLREAFHYAVDIPYSNDLLNDANRPAKGTMLHPALQGSAWGELDAPSFDMSQARSILEEAGFTWQEDRLHYPE